MRPKDWESSEERANEADEEEIHDFLILFFLDSQTQKSQQTNTQRWCRAKSKSMPILSCEYIFEFVHDAAVLENKNKLDNKETNKIKKFLFGKKTKGLQKCLEKVLRMKFGEKFRWS